MPRKGSGILRAFRTSEPATPSPSLHSSGLSGSNKPRSTYMRTQTHTQTHTDTHTLARHVLMRRQTDKTRQHKDRLQQLCRLSFKPMIEATLLRVFRVGRICRCRWLIRPPFPHLGIASLAQVSKTGPCPLPENSLASYRFEKLTLALCLAVYTHTHALVIQGFIWRVTINYPTSAVNMKRRSEREASLAVANTLAYAISEQNIFGLEKLRLSPGRLALVRTQ